MREIDPTQIDTRGPPIVLIYEFKNVRPVELVDFTKSLLAVGDQYKAFVRREHVAFADDDYKLYVKEVRTGSIIAELIDRATQGQLIGPYTPFIVDFAHQLGQCYDFLKGIREVKEVKEWLHGATKKDLQQLSQIVEPVAKDGGSQINFIAQQGGTIIVNSPLTSLEANAVQNGLRRLIEARPDETNGKHIDQVLFWYQVRADKAAKPGDLGIIQRFSGAPVKVRFSSDEVKRAMLDRTENPFQKLFILDVDVTFVNGKPVLYKVLEVKDTMDFDND